MAIVELSHRELTTLNFVLAIAEHQAVRDKCHSLTEKVLPLKVKISAVIDNNYNDREDDNDG
jgi:hypothetical protein